MTPASDPSGTRLVPMTRKQRDYLLVSPTAVDRRLAAVYDAAPADPAEAIRSWFDAEYALDDETTTLDDSIAALLAALGVPANPANEEHDA